MRFDRIAIFGPSRAIVARSCRECKSNRHGLFPRDFVLSDLDDGVANTDPGMPGSVLAALP